MLQPSSTLGAPVRLGVVGGYRSVTGAAAVSSARLAHALTARKEFSRRRRVGLLAMSAAPW